MANVIACCDGTWNTADERDYGLPCPTNVAKVHNALADVDGAGVVQKKYYHTGVGTEGGKLQKLIDGALGDGLEKNVQSAYKWLGDSYRPNDKIFIFGFSRGAYTARYLAGMITTVGLADFSDPTLSEKTKWQRVAAVLAEYRKRASGSAEPTEAPTLPNFAFYSTTKRQECGATPIEFLGVWETVGALGIPSDLPVLQTLDQLGAHRFCNTRLSPLVNCARHAVAIDECRQNFTPTLWDDVATHRDAKQIWFPGVHSDVGGGYPQSGLADNALKWMIDEATARNLAFNPNAVAQIDPDPRGVLHDFDTGIFQKLKSLPRSVPRMVQESSDFHTSATERQRNWPIETAPYWRTRLLRPGESSGPIDIFAQQHWNATGLFLEAGVDYFFKAEGEWIDGAITSEPDGSLTDHKFHIHEIIHNAIDEAADLTSTLTGGMEKNPWWGKRVENAPWFALIGMIASGYGTDDNGNPVPYDPIVIGKGNLISPFRAEKSGYLYCFANDVWAAYDNNRGSVRLTVTRR